MAIEASWDMDKDEVALEIFRETYDLSETLGLRSRLLLRPQRAGRVQHSTFYYGPDSPLREYRIGDRYFPTRARAAQAAYR
ncbi:hypothetical protein LCGC14_2191530 [marine sediment metagenome]|uniref:Uncharacterized protein n=1 Tax=marine sediment metagenome TaxID=412755 RepID=A0A0F9DJL3_9ZZZZ